VSTSPSTTETRQDFELWSIRGLIVKHKLAALVVAGLCAATVVTLVLVVLGSRAGAVTDRTTCTQWGSTNQSGQTAYARLYLSEHGAVASYGSTPAAVIDAINFGCGVAYGDDVGDTATVVQAIRGTF
jgi:hypothetical protein